MTVIRTMTVLMALLSCAACSKGKNKPSELSDSETTQDTLTEGDTNTDTDTDTDTATCTGEACLARTTDPSLDAGTDADAPIDCGLAPGGPEMGTHVLRFENSDASVRVYLERVFAGTGGESLIFDLVRMFIATEGQCIAIVDEADLEYVNSWHNWMDEAKGTFEEVRYEMIMEAEDPWRLTFSAFDAASDDQIQDPIEMIATGGPIGMNGVPWTLPVVITEVMAHNVSGRQDENGEFDPWIEIHNKYSESLNLSGYYLSNDKMNRQQWSFPGGTGLSGGEYLVITADGETGEGTLHTGFVLSPDGGDLVLTSSGGTTSGERGYGPQSQDVSMVFDEESDGFIPAATPSPGAE